MNGTPASLQISLRTPAVSSASWRDSTTQGPAIRNNGLSRPTSNPQSFIHVPRRPHGRLRGRIPAKRGPCSALRRPRLSETGVCRGRPQIRKASCRDGSFRLAGLVLQGGFDESREKRMAGTRRRRKLGVELAADQPGMRRQLDHFAQLLALGDPGYAQALVLQPLHVLVVDFVAVAMALVDDIGAVDLARKAARLERRGLRAQAHRAAEVGFVVAALDPAVAVLPLG